MALAAQRHKEAVSKSGGQIRGGDDHCVRAHGMEKVHNLQTVSEWDTTAYSVNKDIMQESREGFKSKWSVTSTASFSVLMFFPVNNLKDKQTNDHYVNSTETLNIYLINRKTQKVPFQSLKKG